MRRSILLTLLVVAAAATAATLDAAENQPDPEIAALREAQNTVKKAQFDLDGLDQNAEEAAIVGQQPAGKGKKVAAHPDLGEALMKEDDATGMPEEDSDASVQAEAMANNVLQEGATEGTEAADPADIAKTFDLAKSMKSTDLLPEGWVEKTDASTGKNYYENHLSGKTTWDPPRSLVAIAMAAAKGQLHAQNKVKMLEMKMRTMEESRSDLGESSSVNNQDTKCPQRVKELLGNVGKLQESLNKIASKLNLTGEQQKLLHKLMTDVVVPEIQKEGKPAAKKPAAGKKPAAKPAAKKAAAKKAGAKPAAKPAAAKKPAPSRDLGESVSVSQEAGEPTSLAEEKALEAKEGAQDMAAAKKQMKDEAIAVAKRFNAEQLSEEQMIKKASVKAGKAIDDKMAKEDAALLASDGDTEASIKNIIGGQKRLETEQALYRGTMTPDQVNAVIGDKAIAKMEKEDLTSDNDFAPLDPNKKRSPKLKQLAAKKTKAVVDEEFD